MVESLQSLQHLAHDPPLLLDGLIWVGVGANGDGARLVARLVQFTLKQSWRVGLGKKLRLKIKPGRHAHIGMGRPGKAIDAAMLTAPIWIDGPIERNVGRTVAGDDGAWLFHLHLGLEGRQILQRLPAVIEDVAGGRLEAAGGIDARTPTPPAIDLDAHPAFLHESIRQPRSAAAERGKIVSLCDLFHTPRLRACSLVLLSTGSERTKQEQYAGRVQTALRRRCSSRRGR